MHALFLSRYLTVSPHHLFLARLSFEGKNRAGVNASRARSHGFQETDQLVDIVVWSATTSTNAYSTQACATTAVACGSVKSRGL